MPPLSAPEPWFRDLAWGQKQAVKQLPSLGKRKELLSLEKFKIERALKNNGGVAKGNWEEICGFKEETV